MPSNKLSINKIFNPSDIKFIPAVALRSVTSKTGKGVYASSDQLYKGAVFGRDSLEVAEDLMLIKPKLVKNILITIASLQGQEYHDENEEEPGKIIHEYRNVVIDGRHISSRSRKILRSLSKKWGGNEEELAYYGSIDATPHFLRALSTYCSIYGYSIMNKVIKTRRGQEATMHEIALEATDWLLNQIKISSSKLLEFKKRNPRSISNQVWKDSEEFYVHENGELANHQRPIASIEVQGLVYDGLIGASELLTERSTQCKDAARDIQKQVFKKLWMEDKRYFALGLDYNHKGKQRLITTTTANPASLLDTKIFDELKPEIKQKYITAIVEKIMGHEFLTDAGIRSRALSESHLVGHWDYHGSYCSWPKETYDIAKGLRRHGFVRLARQLENRLINICLKLRAYPEFVYVDGPGRVLASSPQKHSHGDVMVVEGTNQPERIQAWTVSAIVAIISSRIKNKLIVKPKSAIMNSWKQELESHIMARIPIVHRHLNPFALAARYPNYKYQLSGKQSDD